MHRCVLGERRAAGAIYGLARLESRDLAADRLDDPGEFRAEAGRLGPAQAEAGNADEVGQPGHDVPRAAVKAGRADAYEHRLITDPGRFNVAEVQDISRAVAVAHDRLHRPPGRLRCFGICTRERPGGRVTHRFDLTLGETRWGCRSFDEDGFGEDIDMPTPA